MNDSIRWEDLPIIDAFDRWAASATLDPGSVTLYRRTGRQLAAYGIRLLGELSRLTICRFQDARIAQGRSPATVNNNTKAIVTLCRWLERRGEFPLELVSTFVKLRLRERRKGPPTFYAKDTEFPVLRDTAYEIAPWFGLAFEIACWTGARRTELRHELREDYDLPGRVLRLTRKTKNKKFRVVSLCPQALEIVRTRAPASGPMFPAISSRARTPFISDDSFKSAMAELQARTKIKCTWHKCRRSFTTWAIVDKVPPPDVARMLGHSDMTVLYQHYYCWLETYNPAIERLGPAA